MFKGKIIYFSKNNFFVESFETNEILKCQLKGQLKAGNIELMAGDNVNYFYNEETCLIHSLDTRINKLARPKVSNIDLLIIVQSSVQPNFNIDQIYKYVAFYNASGISNIIIALTKTDLVNLKRINTLSLNIDNLSVLDINDENDYKKLLDLIKSKSTVFVGQSGVGKSSLLNKINPGFSIKTNEISKALNRGKHTTTNSHLHKICDGYLIDTPGFSSFDINMSKSEFAKCFKIFNDNSHLCKFNDCFHINEPKCEIKKLVERKKISETMYHFYLNFITSL